MPHLKDLSPGEFGIMIQDQLLAACDRVAHETLTYADGTPNTDAIGRWLEARRPAIRGHCSRRVHSSGVDDAAAEVALRILQRPVMFVTLTAGQRWVWVMTVASRHCRDQRRSASVRRRREAALDCVENREPGPVRAAEERELRDVIAAAVAGLSPVLQAAWRMWNEGLSARDAAAASQVALATHRGRLTRAKAALRAALAGCAR